MAGSSPRGRGTRVLDGRPAVRQRFIPARAGNSDASVAVAAASPVHPRAGGELRHAILPILRLSGSSPRGRGTRRWSRPWRPPSRFIPARAGNSAGSLGFNALTSVHPRAGGELPRPYCWTTGLNGSSPRGRGTRLRAARRVAGHRFIPARAGNSRRPRCRPRAPPVHPRAGGELKRPKQRFLTRPGSSPRGRGTLFDWLARAVPGRFIPARAGNSARGSRPLSKQTVHPRAGGELDRRSSIFCRLVGSSPRGRGTHGRAQSVDSRCRFIPARAGNSKERETRTTHETVHPRAGGELEAKEHLEDASAGSSPRGRGTLRESFRAKSSIRFIPARAGNSSQETRDVHSYTVHPRAGGELQRDRATLFLRDGSSPRGRGTLIEASVAAIAGRFIPARAGNSRRRVAVRSCRTVHPRAGGELPKGDTLTPEKDGSSPRGRGTRTAPNR